MFEIREDRCIGCGICKNICPDGIEMINGKASIKDENSECIKQAANACPQNAIILDKETENKSLSRDFQPGDRTNQGRGIGAGKGKGLGRGPRDGRGRGRGGGGRRRW